MRTTSLFVKVLLPVLAMLQATTMLTAQVGQNNFRYIHPTPLGIGFNESSFADNNNGIAVGTNAAIAVTNDGGATWKYGVYVFTSTAGFKQRPVLNDVHFVTPTTAYAVGDSGLMIKSVDGGLNWTPLNNNPLYRTGRNINAVRFVSATRGFIGGAPQSFGVTDATYADPNFSPRLYFTNDGGLTWDSIASPIGVNTMVGRINDPLNPGLKKPITSAGKTIKKIVFTSTNVGYIIGDAGGGNGSGNISVPAYSLAYPGGSSTITSWHVPLVWKFDNGVLTDYSPSKEKFGVVTGTSNTVTTTTVYNKQSLPASNWSVEGINDNLVMVGANQGYLYRIFTGTADNTALAFNPAYTPNLSGESARGRYEILNIPISNPPLTQTTPALPATYYNANTSRALITTITDIAKTPNGDIYVASGQNSPMATIGKSTNGGLTWSLIDNSNGYPNAAFNTVAVNTISTTPNGSIHTFSGINGFISKSTNGVNWTPLYKNITFASGFNKMAFADCNNGMVMGNAGLALATVDGGANWINKTIASFGPTVSILGMDYPAANRLYFSATNGNVYSSPDMATTINLLLVPSRSSNVYGISTWGTGNTTRIWATAYRSTAPLNERVVVYRSLNNGATWDTIKQFAAMTPSTSLISQAQVIKFVSNDVGYMAGTRGYVYKTTDGGTTWTLISADPSLATNTGFTGQHAFGVYGNTLVYWTLISTTRYMYKSTNGGASWTSNIFPITVDNKFVTNISDFVMHDENNFIALTGPSNILITNNGGASWRFDEAPSGGGFTAGQFLPVTVPAGTPMQNRRLILAGSSVPTGGGTILEHVPTGAVVSSTEAVIGSCTNTTNGTISLSASGGITPYTYSLDGGAFQTANTFTGVAAGNHTIAIKDGSCSPAVTKSITVGTRPIPLVNAGPDKTMVAGDNGVYLEGGATNTNPVSVTWTPAANLTNATTFLTTAKPANTTTYTLTVTDANGCVATDNAVVTVLPYCLKVMDAFTPNGDGQNDRWIVTNNGGQCVQQVYVTVHNRYGSIVYKNDNYQNNWDGTYNGKPIADGTYYYVVKYTLVNGGVASVKGDVTILR
jgi:gliding motility-associated-like protein